MRIVLVAALLLFGFACFAQDDKPAPPPFEYYRDFKRILDSTKDKTNRLYYHKLLPRFKSKDSVISRADMLALLIGFTENKSYHPDRDMDTEKEIFDMNENGDYQDALDMLLPYLEKHPLSLRGLKEASYSYNQLRKADSAKYYMDLVDRVMSAMIYSGKGKTPETAIFSLGLVDGEHFIPNVGLAISRKNTGKNKHKGMMEIITALTDESIYVDYFFNIQHAIDKMGGDEDVLNEPRPVKKPKKSSKKDKKEKGKDKKDKTKEGWATPSDAPATDSMNIQAPADSLIIKAPADSTGKPN